MHDTTDPSANDIAARNETDADRRRSLIARTWTEDAGYVDAMMEGHGRAELDALIAVVQERFPGPRLRLRGVADAHRARVRFARKLLPEHGAAVAKGTDPAEPSDDGRPRSGTGLLDAITHQ